jgi:hypothetical protein
LKWCQLVEEDIDRQIDLYVENALDIYMRLDASANHEVGRDCRRKGIRGRCIREEKAAIPARANE